MRLFIATKKGKASLIAFLFLCFFVTGCRQKTQFKQNGSQSLENPVAAVYYSAGGDVKEKGASKLFLIDDKGRFSEFKQDKLEMGSFEIGHGKVFLPQRKTMLQIENKQIQKIKTFSKKEQVIQGYGQSSGFLPKKNVSYFIYNHSVLNKTRQDDLFTSKIRWGNEKNYYGQETEGLIETIGDDGEYIYYLAAQGRKENLHQISVKGKKLSSKKYFMRERLSNGEVFFTNLVSYKKDLLTISAESKGKQQQFFLVQINKNNPQKLKKHRLTSYLGTNTKYYFFNKKSLHVQDEEVFFVDGYGNVYLFNMKTGNLTKKFHLQNYEREEELKNEMVYFKGDKLYFFHQDPESREHLIDQYNLEGERMNTLKIVGLKEQLNGEALWDFQIF